MRWESVLDRRSHQRQQWHYWFAWHPVQLPGPHYLNDGDVVWLESVWRRREGMVWHYESVLSWRLFVEGDAKELRAVSGE